MSLKVKFFEDNLVDAIGAGVYEIYKENSYGEDLLHVGESVFILVRCAGHLYEIRKGYLGLKKEMLDNEDITLTFRLNSLEDDKNKRQKIELDTIHKKKPKMQSGIKDRVKSVEEMIEEMTKLLAK